jgi:hypothetical protein
MEAIDHLHRVWSPLAHAIRIQGTAIAADQGDHRMLGQPRRDRRGRAIGPQVHDPMCRQIDHNGAIPVAPPPGPLVYADGLEG